MAKVKFNGLKCEGCGGELTVEQQEEVAELLYGLREQPPLADEVDAVAL